MKKIGKIIIILIVILFACSCLIYIDYFIVKNRTTTPKIAIKKEINESLVVYNAVLYKVWYCKTNDTYTIGGYSDKDAICPIDYEYDDNDNYKNGNNLLISKHDLQLISQIYTSDMIETFNTKSELDDAIYVALHYGMSLNKELTVNGEVLKSSDGSNIVIYPEYKLNNDKYEWVYNEEIKYCMNSKGQIAPYQDNLCGEYEDVKMNEKWCNLYKNSTLVYNDIAKSYCNEN